MQWAQERKKKKERKKTHAADLFLFFFKLKLDIIGSSVMHLQNLKLILPFILGLLIRVFVDV